MTNKEKLSKAYEYIEKANKLIDEVAHADSDGSLDEDNPVADYINVINDKAINKDLIYYISDDGDVSDYLGSTFDDNVNYNPYYQFLTQPYAEEAARMYKMICMQLAFKWCHDRDYVPDWTDGNEFKWYIYYDTELHCYSSSYVCSSYVCSSKGCAEVYFSSKEIAQKCADWLNSMKEENEI